MAFFALKEDQRAELKVFLGGQHIFTGFGKSFVKHRGA